ncbi:YicC/YloC family endoribonuclease [Clostridium sp. MB40-C1]|uniref:YicC/YloC family endoribonuclease n=1 Tax=Clostridium sp. MB40-C1 TaxID=3070996 RepID=UPI0027E1C465|nr:YicC/YloC family endoribonuclease [Clostridium sp. MB40-C1]WMJ82104.1 YicC/YloC family endoribonuclease [Clostridium sp. MB40-C1]
MVKSMTGFGRAISEEGTSRSFTIEIKTVNHRYFDLNVRMPRTLVSLENKVRETINSKISRGKVDVFISQNSYDEQDREICFNHEIGDNYFKCLEKIKDRYDVANDISISLIAKFPEVITMEKKEEDLDQVWESLKTPLGEALDGLVDMRKKEGEKLHEDILLKCNSIKQLVDNVEEKSPIVVKEYKLKLESRLSELLDSAVIDENRIATEVAMFADKASIDEEIVRLNSHVVQLKENLLKEEPVGRKLDFIVQEMNREANTIASKANDLDIVNSVINIKNYIEKIREQVQNIE